MLSNNHSGAFQLTENQILEIIRKVVDEVRSNSAPAHPLLSPEQVAKKLNIDAQRVRRMCNSGELSAFRIGKYLRIHSTDLEEYLTRCDLGDPKKRRRHLC